MITTLSERCWRLIAPDGKDYDEGEGTQHFGTEMDAADWYRTLRERSGWGDGDSQRDLDLTPSQFDSPCVIVTCDGDEDDPCYPCRVEPEDDAWGTIHFPSEADARSMLDCYEFRAEPAPGRRAWCESCRSMPHAYLGDSLACDRCGNPIDYHTLWADEEGGQ